MPFGLANAPDVFQRILNQMLALLTRILALAYLDDILIPGARFKEGMDNLKNIFEGLRLYINYYELTNAGIRRGETKIRAVSNFPTVKKLSPSWTIFRTNWIF